MAKKKSLKQAQREANIAALDQLGSNPADFQLDSELNVIELACGDFINRVKENITSAGLDVSGKIADITTAQNGDVIEISAYSHLLYMDKGVSGTQNKYNTPYAYTDKRPPVSAFKDWIAARQLNSRNNEPYSKKAQDFKDKNAESVAWAISTHIWKQGIKPKNIYEKEIQGLVDDVAEVLTGFSIQNIIVNIGAK